MRDHIADRLRRWQGAALPLAQAALAAGLSWLVAVHVAGHPSPFFAPCAAVICLGITLGQRLRRGVELIVGVAIGTGIGGWLIAATGTGPWQIALVVALAMSTAVLLDGGAIITVQAAVTAVLVATLSLPGETLGFRRLIDGVIGGAAALVVMALVPANPVAVVARDAGRVLRELAGALHGVARALKGRDVDTAAAVLARARTPQRSIGDLEAALQTGDEITAIAPIRWLRAGGLTRYRRLVPPIDYAVRNTRVLVRRALLALRDGDAVPNTLCEAIDALADGVDVLAAELAAGEAPTRSKSRLLTVARLASPGMIADGAFSSMVIVAQLRSTTVDLLQAAGMTRDEALAALPSPARARRRSGRRRP